MPNNMRDRLIEILTDNLPHCDNPLQDTYDEIVERLANHLIENGAIIPPCNVGDDIWIVKCYEGKPLGIVKDKVQMIGITSRGFHIKARNHHDHNKMYMLGKTVFLTREDAEKALRERDGE